MALERRNPLPVGLYWIDIFEKHQLEFRLWLSNHGGEVEVIRTESFDPVGGYSARDWYLFRVVEPVQWDGPGFPDIAESQDTTSEDTSVRPPPPSDPLEGIEDALSRPAKAATTIIVGGTATIALYFVFQAMKERTKK